MCAEQGIPYGTHLADRTPLRLVVGGPIVAGAEAKAGMLGDCESASTYIPGP